MVNRTYDEMNKYKCFLFYGIGNQFKECIKLFKEKEILLFDSDSRKWGGYWMD